jgi:hypothetical protein
MALARTCAPEQAEFYWKGALRLNATYNPGEEEVFTCAVLYLHLSRYSYLSRDAEEGKRLHAHAYEILAKKKTQFLIPGVGTYIFDGIRARLLDIGVAALPTSM